MLRYFGFNCYQMRKSERQVRGQVLQKVEGQVKGPGDWERFGIAVVIIYKFKND